MSRWAESATPILFSSWRSRRWRASACSSSCTRRASSDIETLVLGEGWRERVARPLARGRRRRQASAISVARRPRSAGPAAPARGPPGRSRSSRRSCARRPRARSARRSAESPTITAWRGPPRPPRAAAAGRPDPASCGAGPRPVDARKKRATPSPSRIARLKSPGLFVSTARCRRGERPSVSRTPGYRRVSSSRRAAVAVEEDRQRLLRARSGSPAARSPRATSLRAPSPIDRAHVLERPGRACPGAGGRACSLSAAARSRAESISVPSRSKTTSAGSERRSLGQHAQPRQARGRRLRPPALRARRGSRSEPLQVVAQAVDVQAAEARQERVELAQAVGDQPLGVAPGRRRSGCSSPSATLSSSV